jgi:hypothetical protein
MTELFDGIINKQSLYIQIMLNNIINYDIDNVLNEGMRRILYRLPIRTVFCDINGICKNFNNSILYLQLNILANEKIEKFPHYLLYLYSNCHTFNFIDMPKYLLYLHLEQLCSVYYKSNEPIKFPQYLVYLNLKYSLGMKIKVYPRQLMWLVTDDINSYPQYLLYLYLFSLYDNSISANYLLNLKIVRKFKISIDNLPKSLVNIADF